MDEQPQSLKSIFAASEDRREALEGISEANSPGYREALTAAIRGYRACLDQISRLSIFSPNETVDDISTNDLPYLLVNYHLADLTLKTPTTSPLERFEALDGARESYERFLHLLDTYALLTPSYARLLETYTTAPTIFSTTASGDGTSRRNSKITNFKAEKELRAQLITLRKNPDYATRDESAVRAVHLAYISYCTHMTFQALEGINREAEVLADAPVPLIPQTTSVEDDERTRRALLVGGGEMDGYSERLDPPLRRMQSALNGDSGPLLSKEGKPLQPFTIVGNRAEIAKNVFRPGHSLPTMTIDEYLDEERRRGGILEGGGEASGQQPEPDEDDMEKADAATMKMRAWDEFTEANPRGAGNTMNRG